MGGFIEVEVFRPRLQREIDNLGGGLLLAADITKISERGLRRILSGSQREVTDDVLDKLCVAFDWDHWDYERHIRGIKEPDHEED